MYCVEGEMERYVGGVLLADPEEDVVVVLDARELVLWNVTSAGNTTALGH